MYSISILSVLGESKLVFLEDALRKYEPDNLSEHGQEVLDELRASIIATRRFAHQLGKSQH